MKELSLFIDGSVDPKSKIGFGAYLAVSDIHVSLDFLKTMVRIQKFEPTSSTRLELQTLLWALSDINTAERRLIIYTDSQNIMGLMGRRQRVLQNPNLNNFDLYQEFFRKIDKLDCHFIKVSGHLVSGKKNEIDKLFTLVDRATRSNLRRDKKSAD